MSSSSVCQVGLKSCLNFNFFNTPPLTDSQIHKEHKNMKNNDNIGEGGWSFLQCLTNSPEINNNKEANKNEKLYVHPLNDRSSSSSSSSSSFKLSTKSLEMCTESLGSENGSNCGGNSNNEIHFSSSLEQLENGEPSPKYCKNWVTEKIMKRSASFPPPLTSISRIGGVQLRPHRECGRLVLKAESVSCSLTCFQTERSGGRLRLHLLQTCEEFETEDEDEEEEEEEEEADVDEIEKIVVVVDVGETEEVVCNCVGEDEENSSVKVRGEMDEKKVSMISRCKEGGEHRGKGLLNWERLWVAS